MTDTRPVSQRHHLVQAPIAPLDEDGIKAAVLGTLCFALATAVTALNQGWLNAHGRSWWTWTCAAGFVLGLIGTAYCVWRRRRRLARGINRDV